MKTPGYVIDADPATGMLHIEYIGFWEEAVANAYEQELARAMAALGAGPCPPGQYRYLVDFTDCTVQSAAMVARFQAFGAGPIALAARIAVISSSHLLTMQIKRMGDTVTAEFFTTKPEAIAWLEAVS